MLKARQTIEQIVNLGIKEVVKPVGFKKNGLYFHRRCGELVQVIHVQLSWTNVGADGEFFINVGLVFDRLQLLDSREITEKPKDFDCCCNFRWRLERLVPDTPPSWIVSEATDVAQTANSLCAKIVALLAYLNQINSIENFLNANWEFYGSEHGLLARLHYTLGNLEIAARYIQEESDFFADRKGMSTDDLIERYKMSDVKDFG